MKRLLSILALLLPVLAGAQSLTINHISDTHTMVKVSGKDRYVMLPVQENAPEARVKVLSNGNEVLWANVCLAIDKTDYLVPLDLGQWGGSSIILDIKMNQGRSLRRDPSDDVCWSEMTTVPVPDLSNKEKKYRPTYHFSPEWGWMNDPNGMVYKDGEWHLFYQFNPYGSFWGNMHWGHAVSKDLVNWENLGIAIAPDALGAIFSGSAVVDKDNTAGFGKDALIAMYTSDGDNQTQSIAYSLDNGRTFTKYAGNPVIIAADTPDFRDPKIFWHEESRQWKVILAAGQEVQLYSSDNLKDWTYDSSFGLSYGNHNGVWECPDLVRLSFEGKEKWDDKDYELTVDNADPRLFLTVGMPGLPYMFNKKFIQDETQQYSRGNGFYGYYISLKQNVDPGLVGEYLIKGSYWASSMNRIVFRYADVLLERAEAYAQLGESDKAIALVNDIRTRAKGSTQMILDYPSRYGAKIYMANYNGTYDKETAIKIVKMERRLEMGLECERFFDLVRWGDAATVLNKYFAEEGDNCAIYLSAQFTADKDEYLPIPAEQMAASNGHYTQNIGSW